MNTKIDVIKAIRLINKYKGDKSDTISGEAWLDLMQYVDEMTLLHLGCVKVTRLNKTHWEFPYRYIEEDKKEKILKRLFPEDI